MAELRQELGQLRNVCVRFLVLRWRMGTTWSQGKLPTGTKIKSHGAPEKSVEESPQANLGSC